MIVGGTSFSAVARSTSFSSARTGERTPDSGTKAAGSGFGKRGVSREGRVYCEVEILCFFARTHMSFVHPLSAMGQPLREEGPPSLRELAAVSVARTLVQDGRRARQEYQEFEDLKGGLDGAFQLARADAIAQQAAEGKKNRVDQEYIRAYEDVMFTKPTTSGPKNEKGLTAQMRTRKRLMQPDLSDLYYAKVQRRNERSRPRQEPLPEALTPEEARSQNFLPSDMSPQFARHAAGNIGFDLAQVQPAWPGNEPDMRDHINAAARQLNLPFGTVRALMVGTRGRFEAEQLAEYHRKHPGGWRAQLPTTP